MPRSSGTKKIVAMVAHDFYHNGVAQELSIRGILKGREDWDIIFARASALVTPDLLKDADLLITARTGIRDPIDLTTNPLAAEAVPGDILWRDDVVQAIVDGVRQRGMGFLALHCTLFCRNRTITDLMDIEPIMHQEVQPVWVHDFNGSHPITTNASRFLINLDEQFAVVIKSPDTAILFKTTAVHDKRQAIGGWCLEQGRGRVVGLLPGHTVFPYRVPQYREIFWRAAHWAMREDVPPFNEG